MMVLSMYLASFALRIVIVLKGHLLCLDHSQSDECIYFTQTVRDEWHQEDPQLISEVLFAVTSMLSFTRLAYILPAHESLGTLQISIGKMIDDMIFMFILMIIGTAFLCGINNVYVPYVISPHLGRLNDTFHFLFWTMFGMANEVYVDMPQFVLAEFVGRVLYGIFTLVIVIVFSISVICQTFPQDDADVEWKFARSKLYLSYFREGLTMPVPFNIIPSPKAVFYILRGIFRRLCCCCTDNSSSKYPPITSVVNDGQTPYRQQVIGALVQRYIESARREFEETKRKDIGNRITELNKAVGRLHADMKVLLLIDDGHTISHATSRDGSSFLGKYITGAKNNFRGFNSRLDDKAVSLVVHQDNGDKEKTESDTRQAEENEATPMECDVVKMEEGRAQETKTKSTSRQMKMKILIMNLRKRRQRREVM
uniref:Transient receptor potential cation channel subfamily C member 2a n=1 Tax=Neogobius melanostomus TaxID=47308 RepID=A0A8C6T1Y4_9GOBI